MIVSSQAVAQVMEVPYRVRAEEYALDTYKVLIDLLYWSIIDQLKLE